MSEATIKIYPLTGLKAMQSSCGGGWRLFVLAKHYAGVSDHIGREQFRKSVLSLGVSKSQFNRWMTEARNNDLFTDIQRMTGEWILVIPSWTRAAQLFDVELGNAIMFDVSLLFGKSWRAHLFASWQSSYTGNGARLVSQKKQAQVSGINTQTQRSFNKQAGVKCQRNYAISNQHASMFSGVTEFRQRACPFKYWDKATHQYKIGWRIPDTRTYSTGVSNKTLRNLSLFNASAEQYSKTMKTIKRLRSEDRKMETQEVYIFDKQSEKGNNLWIHCVI